MKITMREQVLGGATVEWMDASKVLLRMTLLVVAAIILYNVFPLAIPFYGAMLAKTIMLGSTITVGEAVASASVVAGLLALLLYGVEGVWGKKFVK